MSDSPLPKTAYLDVTPIKEKWYISEGFKVLRQPLTDEEKDAAVAFNKGASRMILAGPFDSEQAANDEIPKLSKHQSPYSWQQK